MNLLDDIPKGTTVTVDSAPIIYVLADTPPFAERFAPLFSAAADNRLRIVISTITLAEVLVGPLKQGEELLAERYRKALTGAQGWTTVPVSDEIAVNAARIRTRHKVKLPDAIQLATALASDSYALITHDRDFKQVREIPILGLD